MNKKTVKDVVVKGKTLQDVARFVARELATIDSVTSTTTLATLIFSTIVFGPVILTVSGVTFL